MKNIIVGCRLFAAPGFHLGESWEALRTAYPWLSHVQLRTALAYYRAYSEEIERRLEIESRWNSELLAARYPGLQPLPKM